MCVTRSDGTYGRLARQGAGRFYASSASSRISATRADRSTASSNRGSSVCAARLMLGQARRGGAGGLREDHPREGVSLQCLLARARDLGAQLRDLGGGARNRQRGLGGRDSAPPHRRRSASPPAPARRHAAPPRQARARARAARRRARRARLVLRRTPRSSPPGRPRAPASSPPPCPRRARGSWPPAPPAARRTAYLRSSSRSFGCTCSNPKRPFTQRLPRVTSWSSGEFTRMISLSCTTSSRLQPTPQ